MRKTKEPSSVRVLLRIPIFRRIWSAIAISSLGDWLGLLATTALAAYLTKNSSGLAQGAAVSGVLLTRLLPDLLLGPVAGAVVDKLDRRKVAVIGDTLAGLLYLSIAITGNLTWLLIAQFLVEAIGLFTNPSKQAMFVGIVPRERLAVANQLNYVSIYGMVPVAAALFALLSTVAQFFGARADHPSGTSALISGPTSSFAIDVALAIDALTYFVVAATVLFSRHLIPSVASERTVGKSIFSLIREGVSFIRHSRVMRAIYIGILGAFGAGGLTAGVAQAYVSSLGAGNAGYGILFGSVFTGLAIGMLVGPKILPTVPRRMVFTSSIGAAGLVLIVMSLLQDFVGATIGAAIMGLFAGIAWINGFTMIGHEVSDALRGRVFGFVMSSVRLTLLATIAAGPVIAGAVGSHLVLIGSFQWRLSGAALVLAAGGLIAILVSGYAARQVGAPGGGFLRLLLRHRRPEDLIDESEYPGVLVVVEGADAATVGAYAAAIERHVGGQGFSVVVCDLADGAGQAAGGPPAATPEPDVLEAGAAEGQGATLRAAADLADLVNRRIRPELLRGSVVVTRDYIDGLVVRFGVQSGMSESPVLRIMAWAVGGLRPDLTVVVDADPADVPVFAAAPAVVAQSADDAAAAENAFAAEVAGDVVQAFLGRASVAPDRYLVVAPLAAGGTLTPDAVERVGSALRTRSPGQTAPGGSVAGGSAPGDVAPAVPADAVPADAVPADAVPVDSQPRGVGARG